MAKKYIGRVRILIPRKPGEPEPEVVFGPRFLEENAESAPDARDKIEAAARRRWRPRRNRGEVIVIDFVRPKRPRRTRYYEFRFAAEGDITARHGTYWGNIEYVPGQLYGFDSRSAQDAWVQEGGRIDEIRRAVKAGILPKGWKADHALDPETEALAW